MTGSWHLSRACQHLPRVPVSLHPSLYVSVCLGMHVCEPRREGALNWHSLVRGWRYKTSGMPLPSLGCADDPAARCRTGVYAPSLSFFSLFPLLFSFSLCLIFPCAPQSVRIALYKRTRTLPAGAVSQKLLPAKSTKGLILYTSPPPLPTSAPFARIFRSPCQNSSTQLEETEKCVQLWYSMPKLC